MNDPAPEDLRDWLIRVGIITPADRVAQRPPQAPAWHPQPPTLRLLGTEDWRRNINPHREFVP